MKFSANFVEDGTISFDYQVVAENGAGLQFFIDGTMQQGVWRSETTTRITFQVKKGFFFFNFFIIFLLFFYYFIIFLIFLFFNFIFCLFIYLFIYFFCFTGNHNLMWLYHQAPNNSGVATVKNLNMIGVNKGSSILPCPPGYFSSQESQLSCQPCAPG